MQSDRQENFCLFYATSATFPSKLANRRQVLHQMTAFVRVSDGVTSILGVAKADDTLSGKGFEVYESGTTFLPHIVLKYLSTIRARKVTHVYCREIRLAALLLAARQTGLFGKFSITFEVHVLQYAQKLDSWLLSRLSRSFEHIITINSWMRDEMVRLGWASRDRIRVAHDAADPAVFQVGMAQTDARSKLGIPAESFVLVYTGRFRTAGMDKGLEGVLRILPELDVRGVPVKLYAVGGSDSEITEYTRVAEAAGADRFCTFVPYMPQAEIVAYHFAADVLLMPFPATEHFSHFMSPLKLFEYLMAGRAILATDLPSVRDVIDDTCVYLIPPDSEAELSEALVALAQDTALRVRLGAAALGVSGKYTWDARARAILDFIGA